MDEDEDEDVDMTDYNITDDSVKINIFQDDISGENMDLTPISDINDIDMEDLACFGSGMGIGMGMSGVKVLRLFVGDDSLKEKYSEAVNKHNAMIDEYFDDTSARGDYESGFDLYMPETCSQAINEQCGDYSGTMNRLVTVDFAVKCSMTQGKYVQGYYMYPRSSISKTPFRMANCVGIIDSGYRGNIIGKFDVIYPDYKTAAMDRLTQICAGDLGPFKVEMVSCVEDLDIGALSMRGQGGLGSSGR